MRFFTKPPPSAGYVLEESFDRCGQAVFSKDGLHRYALVRSFEHPDVLMNAVKVGLFVGLNPSSAGSSKNDTTVSKDVGFAQRLGCDAVIKVNLYSAIMTESARLRETSLVGPEFVEVMRLVWDIVHQLTKTLLCWGSHELVTRERVWAVAPLLPRPFECFGTTADGQPRHTCRLPYATPLQRWKGI